MIEMDICVQNLSVSFAKNQGKVNVLRHVDITFHKNEITAVVGESGSGKSILGAAVLGLLDDSASVTGKIMYTGQNLLELQEEQMCKIRGFHIGWIAQDPLSAMDPMVKIGRQITEARCFLNHKTTDEEKHSAIKSLQSFGLSAPDKVYQNYPCELSGGMAQRVMSAMMTYPEPEWIIADEPTKGLDAFSRQQVAEIFRKLKKNGTSIFLITHDLQLAMAIADKVAVMYAGEILEYGETNEVFKYPGHPYTKGLINALPENGLMPIPGSPPNMSKIPGGCIFSPRCRFKNAACLSAQLLSGTELHMIRCCRKKESWIHS
nr:ABC transporter ATP-binding protein [uncultured Dialister sp.]